MALVASESVKWDGVADLLFAHAQHEGSAGHPYPTTKLSKGPHEARDLADAVHYLCTLHGRNPGIVDLATRALVPPELRDWAEGAVVGFARERAYLTRIVVAAGPLPSTPGQAESEAAVIGQRHALEMLASSDRAGCALGAAMALALDWRAVRIVLDIAARRFSVEPPPMRLPDPAETAAAATILAADARVERALMFGARQILVQQRGLWELLESRQIARGNN
jgi:hypothetical protein